LPRSPFGERGLPAALANEVGEALEQIVRILRSRRCFRVVLDREDRFAGERNAAIGAGEERDMRLHDALRQAGRVDRETGVPRGDLALARCVVLDGVVRTMVPLMHLLGHGTKREGQNLVTEADAEDGYV